MSNVAMIPARYGSKRLPRKNLQTFAGTTLLEYAILRSQAVFADQDIWVNGDNEEFEAIAKKRGVNYYPRPEELGGDSATSEDFITDFLDNIECNYVFQIHSITPLMTPSDLSSFVHFVIEHEFDTVLSGVEESLECVYEESPVNFTFAEKTNSQDLKPVFRITWPVSAWKKETFLKAKRLGSTGTYSGRIGFFAVDFQSGIAVKTQKDLELVTKLYELREA